MGDSMSEDSVGLSNTSTIDKWEGTISSITSIGVGTKSSIQESGVSLGFSLSLPLAVDGTITSKGVSIGIGTSGTWDWHISSIHTGGRLEAEPEADP